MYCKICHMGVEVMENQQFEPTKILHITLTDAFKSWWKNMFSFSGRSTRKEFFVAWCILEIISFLLGGCVAFAIGRIPTVGIFWLSICSLSITISIMVRRLHDINGNGWLVFIVYGVTLLLFSIFKNLNCMILIDILLLVCLVYPSDPGDNQYGPNRFM